jgi:hypothetical protein
MKHRTAEELRRVAEVYRERPRDVVMSRGERLARWAEILEQQPGRHLSTLHGTEYRMGAARDDMRADNSPISVAFSDAILRAEGLKNDTYGEAKRFFGVSDWQLHDILCYCHYGVTMAAAAAARGVRAAIAGDPNPGVFARMRHMIVG